jgi:hypothetical protein
MRSLIAGITLLVLAVVVSGSASRGLFASAAPPTPRVEYRIVSPAQAYSPLAPMPVAYVAAAGAPAERVTRWSNVGLLAAGAAFGAAIGYASNPRGVRVPSPKMQEDDGKIDGISGALGGGKTKQDVEKNPIVVGGSFIAFLLTLGGLTFSALNPDAMEDIAKSVQKPCTKDKIVNGRTIVCQADGKYAKFRP